MNKDKFWGLNLKDIVYIMAVLVQIGVFAGILKTTVSNLDKRTTSIETNIEALYKTIKLINEDGPMFGKRLGIDIKKIENDVEGLKTDDKQDQFSLQRHNSLIVALETRMSKIEEVVPKITEMSIDIRWMREALARYEKRTEIK